MRKGRVEKHVWHDEWIAEHLLGFSSYREMIQAYNAEFGVDMSESSLNGHIKNDLGISKPRVTGEFLTEEQKRFIEEYYPHHSVKDTTAEFNRRFGTNKKKYTMLNYARRHGLQVDPAVVTKSKLDASHAPTSKIPYRKVGDIRFDGRYWVVKTENGWKNVNRAVWEKHYGSIPKGYAVIHLDGDCGNYEIDNLQAVPFSYLGLLDRNGMRSTNAEITKTGVLWCNLYIK